MFGQVDSNQVFRVMNLENIIGQQSRDDDVEDVRQWVAQVSLLE